MRMLLRLELLQRKSSSRILVRFVHCPLDEGRRDGCRSDQRTHDERFHRDSGFLHIFQRYYRNDRDKT